MSHKKQPQTSLDANNSIQEMKPDHWHKILDALKEIGEGSAEQIGKKAGLDHWQTNRRVSELAKNGKIYRTGNKVTTKTGRSAYTWKILGE